LRGADGRFGTALYARGQIRALAFLPLRPRSRDPSFTPMFGAGRWI
jgi:hypothetical protein